MSEINTHFDVEVGSERSFGLVFSFVFALIALLPLLAGSGPRWIFLVLAAGFAALAMFRPSSLKVPNLLWFKFGNLLGAIVAPIVMGIIFLIAFIPTGLLVRFSGKDLMSLRLEPAADSYWVKRETPPNSMKLQY